MMSVLSECQPLPQICFSGSTVSRTPAVPEAGPLRERSAMEQCWGRLLGYPNLRLRMAYWRQFAQLSFPDPTLIGTGVGAEYRIVHCQNCQIGRRTN